MRSMLPCFSPVSESVTTAPSVGSSLISPGWIVVVSPARTSMPFQLPAGCRVDEEADRVHGDAGARERFRRDHRIALAGLLAVADQNDDALLRAGRKITRGLLQRQRDRRVALRLAAVDEGRDRGA